MRRARLNAIGAAVAVALTVASAALEATLSPDLEKALTDSKFVYISSTRKDGSLSKAAEIWFLYRNGAVYVVSATTSWRARRIKAGRPQAKITVGNPTGPSFMATGAIVSEPEVHQILFDTYAKKYPDRWPQFEDRFRQVLKDGSDVLIKYTPKE